MIIFKDRLTGDEFFTDSSKYTIIEDSLYQVALKYERRKEGEIILAGSNPSAEEASEGFDESVQAGLDVVLNHKLNEISFGTKPDFKAYLKTYSKRLIKHFEDQGTKPEEIEKIKVRMVNASRFLINKLEFKDLQFFMGDHLDPDALIAPVIYQGDDIFMYLIADSVVQEKV